MKCMFNILSNILIDHICDLNQYWYCTIVSTSIHSLSIFLDIAFIQGWQTYLVFYSIQSHYIDFKIPQMCFIISSCEIHSQINPCSTNCIVQRREIFYSLFVCKELLWLFNIYYILRFYYKSGGPTRRRNAHEDEWQSFLGAKAISHAVLKRRHIQLMDWWSDFPQGHWKFGVHERLNPECVRNVAAHHYRWN